jgi:hypothetical protein
MPRSTAKSVQSACIGWSRHVVLWQVHGMHFGDIQSDQLRAHGLGKQRAAQADRALTEDCHGIFATYLGPLRICLELEVQVLPHMPEVLMLTTTSSGPATGSGYSRNLTLSLI